MSDPNRSTSRWSTSMSVTSKSTNATNQTTPLVVLRRKLFRQSASHKKNFSQRMEKSKHDVEELFKLYYSNDIKFDTFQRQIVTGTRIQTAQTSQLSQDNLTTSSTNAFNGKHFVSREQWSPLDLHCNEQQQPTNNETITAKQSSTKRSVHIRTDNNAIINPPVSSSSPGLSPSKVIPILPNPTETSSSIQQEDLCDSSLIKSVTVIGDFSNEFHESINKRRSKSKLTQRPISSKSSILTIPPPPSLLVTNTNSRKDPNVLSNTSISTMGSSQQHKSNRSAIVTGSAVIVRQRSSSKLSRSRQRTNFDSTTTTISSLSQSTTKPRSPSICSPLSIDPDIPELPVYVGGQRVVSIPSKCSRYVLVTFPEVPLRYNAPSYVERLLLPERFPTLFQNIVQSYDPHLTNVQPPRNTK
ncbi:unnamed protein product [Rotaria sp. Silwood2]|nr:unnamed protein product [Rotaria sp. Silwood2]CAF2707584.1 unnamed protein product [Rotaria sp. Silwood2]CAF2967610.1 unnamed protein product [Rotaria sp. Silwood2]CAF3111991.1 unnamed protein product [Rotaria sp. Silwood2]CAF3854401.1 unnamed protein product [Rotaria sp. Silwood2]